MTDRRLRLALISALLVVASLALPSGAAAAGQFFRGFSDPVLAGPDGAHWYEKATQLGVNLTRIDVAWNAVAGPNPPADPTNPGDPSYDFDRIDQAVREAAARGVPVILTIQFAPNWALGPNPNTGFGGVWKPDPEAFGDFVQALATRYSGSYSPDLVQPPLPEIDYLEPWNEPNLPQFLSPQWKGPKNNKPASPALYRGLLNAAYDAAHGANPDIMVVAGATSPFGDDPGDGPRIRPLFFLRELLCLRKRGGDLEKTKCKEKAKLDAISHHPIDTEGGPRRSAISPDDVTVPDFKNVVATLRVAERKGTVVPKGKRPAWATEVWWETQPPDMGDHAFPQPKVARWIPEMFFSLREQGAQAAMWLQLVDSEVYEDGLGGYQSGIYNLDGTAKPLAAAWRFPFYADRKGKKKVRAFAIPPGSGKLAIEERRGGDWKTLATMNATAMRPVQKQVKVSGGADLRATLNGESSPTTRMRSVRAERRAEARSETRALRDAYSQGPVDPLENPYVEVP